MKKIVFATILSLIVLPSIALPAYTCERHEPSNPLSPPTCEGSPKRTGSAGTR